jgi:hypothetical protein
VQAQAETDELIAVGSQLEAERDELAEQVPTTRGSPNSRVSSRHLLSENVLCGVSVCRGNPTRFGAHVLTLVGDLFRRGRSHVAKQMFYDTIKAQA